MCFLTAYPYPKTWLPYLYHELHECLGSTAIDDSGLDDIKQPYSYLSPIILEWWSAAHQQPMTFFLL